MTHKFASKFIHVETIPDLFPLEALKVVTLPTLCLTGKLECDVFKSPDSFLSIERLHASISS